MAKQLSVGLGVLSRDNLGSSVNEYLWLLVALGINKYGFTVQFHEFLLSKYSLMFPVVRTTTRSVFCLLPDFLSNIVDEDAFRFAACLVIFTWNMPSTWTCMRR